MLAVRRFLLLLLFICLGAHHATLSRVKSSRSRMKIARGEGILYVLAECGFLASILAVVMRMVQPLYATAGNINYTVC